MAATKVPSTKELVAVRSIFSLRDDTVLRNGDPVRHRQTANRSKYRKVSFAVGDRRVTWKLSRMKFFLAYGWLPEIVDHKNGNTRNDSLTNLRAASPESNQWNRKAPKKESSLPRGVMRRGARYEASLKVRKRLQSLGLFDTPEEASAAVRKASRNLRGSFHKYRRKLPELLKKRNK